jgi:hypothetical protein
VGLSKIQCSLLDEMKVSCYYLEENLSFLLKVLPHPLRYALRLGLVSLGFESN